MEYYTLLFFPLVAFREAERCAAREGRTYLFFIRVILLYTLYGIKKE